MKQEIQKLSELYTILPDCTRYAAIAVEEEINRLEEMIRIQKGWQKENSLWQRTEP